MTKVAVNYYPPLLVIGHNDRKIVLAFLSLILRMQKYIELLIECIVSAFGILYYVFKSKDSELEKPECEVSDGVTDVDDK